MKTSATPKGIQQRICPVCGKEFTPNSGSQIYCCPQCARKAGVEKNRPRIDMRTAMKAKQNPYLLYAFNFECAVCRWSLPSFDTPNGGMEPAAGCEMHHIVPVAEGGSNKADNLILLCPNCHKLAHAGYYSKDFLRTLTHTEEEAKTMRERWAVALGCGLYWIDDITIKRGALKTKIETGEEF